MILQSFSIIFISCALIAFLSIKFIKNSYKENLIVISLATLFMASYITFVIDSVYIPIVFQISIFIFSVLIPTFFVTLQYNNIRMSNKILYLIMKFYYNSKEYQKTIEILTKLISLEGNSAKYLYLLGKSYSFLGDNINARDCYTCSVELDSSDYKSYYELGRLMDESNNKNAAMNMYENALKIKPNFYEAWESLAICLTSKGLFKEAVDVYKKAVELYNDSFEMYYNIAMIESELGNFEEAIEAFEKAGKIKPDLYMAHFNLGKLYAMKKNYDKAIDAFSKILNSTSYGSVGYYNLAIMYANKEEYQKAMTTLEYAMELDEKFIKEANHEYSFNPIRPMIEEYKKAKEKEKIMRLQKQNLMEQRFKIFKFKDELNLDTKNEVFEENLLIENHA